MSVKSALQHRPVLVLLLAVVYVGGAVAFKAFTSHQVRSSADTQSTETAPEITQDRAAAMAEAQAKGSKTYHLVTKLPPSFN